MSLLTGVSFDVCFLVQSSTIWGAGAGVWGLQKTAQSAGSARVSRPAPAPPACCYANDSLVGLICLLEPMLDRLSRPPDDWDLGGNGGNINIILR